MADQGGPVRRWLQVAVRSAVPAATAALGGYLLTWAWRWPHSDMRNAWATAAGVGVLAIGLLATLVTVSRRGWLVVAASAVALVALAGGVLVLGAVSEGQRRACGDQLPACDSLLRPVALFEFFESAERRTRGYPKSAEIHAVRGYAPR